MYATRIGKLSWTKAIEVPKSARAHQFTKKIRLERAKELLRLHENGPLPKLVFLDEMPFQIEQFKANKMIRSICQRGQLKVYNCVWPPQLKRRR